MEQDMKAAHTFSLDSSDATETMVGEQQMIFKDFQSTNQEILEKIDEKAAETQTEQRSTTEELNNRLD